MTAAEAREHLEAAAWRATGPTVTTHDKLVDAILAAADAYAAAKVLEEMDRRDGRQRLAEAAAEYFGEGS